MKETTHLDINDIRQRCFSVINNVAPGTDMDDYINGWLSELDFIEILLRIELEFNYVIREGKPTIDDFDKVSDLVEWLVNALLAD